MSFEAPSHIPVAPRRRSTRAVPKRRRPAGINDEILTALKDLLERFEYEFTQAHGDKFGPAAQMMEAAAAHRIIAKAEGR